MAQRVGICVGCDLGIAGCSAGKEHEHKVLALGAFFAFRHGEGRSEHAVFRVKASPAFPFALDHDAVCNKRTFLKRKLRLIDAVADAGYDDGGDAGGGKSVGKILFQKLVGGEDCDSADFLKRHHNDPELIMTAEHQKHLVALFDADGSEVVGGAVGKARNIGKGEAVFHAVARNVHHGQLFRVVLTQLVHNVKGKVELFGIFEGNGFQRAIGIFDRVHPLRPDVLALGRSMHGRGRNFDLGKGHHGLFDGELRNRIARRI